MKIQREIDEVIHYLHMAMSIAEPIGFAFEPIATMSDPDNDIEGDYVLRLSFLNGDNGKNRYVSIFQCYISMNELMVASEKQFEDVIFRLLKEAITYRFKAQAATMSGDSVTIGSHGPDPDLGAVLMMAQEMMGKVRH